MKKTVIIFSILLILISACSKTEVVELPITSSDPKALDYYKKAILSREVGDGPEKRALLDSALSIDPNFAMALELYESQDPIIQREHQELANLAAYLVSDYSDYMTGEVVTIDGGEWIYNAGEFSWLDKVPKKLWGLIEKVTRKK